MAAAGENLLLAAGLSPRDLERAMLSKCAGAAGGARLSTVRSADGGGAGAYLSAIAALRLAWRGAGAEALPDGVLVKAPSAARMSPAGGKDYAVDVDDFLPPAHNNECDALRRLDGCGAVPTPKVYYARRYTKEDSGVIVMEHFGRAVHFPTGAGATDGQVRALLACFAGWHAHVYAMEGDRWMEGLGVDTGTLAKLFDAVPRDMLPLLAKLGGGRMADALALIPADSVVRSGSACAQWMADAPRRTGLPPVLVHGNVWSHNVLWQADERGGASDRLAALIDWKLCRAGAPTEDIAFLLSISVSGAYRRSNLDALLRYYYERLADNLSAKGKPAPFTYDQLEAGYKETLPLSVMFAVFGAPVLVASGMEGADFLLDNVHDLIVDVFGQ